MSIAAWIAIAVVALLHVGLLRLTVRLLAKPADNGWDNAIGYAAVTTALVVALRWVFGTHSLVLYLVAPPLFWIAQTVALKILYQVRPPLAWFIGVVHAAITTMAVTAVGFTAAAIAAYILYGRIIGDPMFLVRLLLRLIGIEL